MSEAKAKTNSASLGEGSVGKLLASLALPAVVAQVINLLYNIVDRIYIGHIPDIGARALTGVGLCTPIIMMVTAFAMLACSGGVPRTSIFMGKKDVEGAEKIVGNCVALVIILAVVLTILIYIFAPQLLTWFGASSATLPYALSYTRIYILGSIFVMITLGAGPFITAQGFAKISMLTTVIGAAINIVLDPVFIFVFNMGVRGAAIATVISQAVSAAWVLKFLTGPQCLVRLRMKNLRIAGSVIGPCLALGVSSFVMVSTESILSISFNSSLSRYGGDLAVGAMTILTSMSQLVMMPLQGVCQGGQPIVSFNFGAGNADRVKKAFKYIFLTCVVYTTLFWAASMLVPRMFAGIFTGDAALMDRTVWAIRIYMAGVFSLGFQISCQQSFLALGQAKISLVMACLRKLILLIPLIFILPNFFADKVLAVFLAEPVSDIIAAAVTTLAFFSRFNKTLEKGVGR
ncbi:MAG: MATE family efflux transporter [Lachnospiraceae bacterium]|nr:MATE family efflux transporter [Lachnospiraceae bacterium]